MSWGGVGDYTENTVAEYGYLNSTGHHIMATIESLFSQAGVSLPTRRYFATGPEASVAYDCEQLTVTCTQIYLGTPGEPSVLPNQCELLMSGDFVVELVRCYPVATPNKRNPDSITPPKVETMNEVALVSSIDAQLLLESGYNVLSTQGVTAAVSFGVPQGAYQAVVMNLSCSLSRI